MTLHRINSTPLSALGLAAASYIQGGFFETGATPDEEMQLSQDADWGSVLVLVQNAENRAVWEADISGAALVVDNTVVGLGGRDTNANTPLAADTVYDIRLVVSNDGTQAGLILTTSGNAPVLPAGYPWVSPVLAAGITDGTSDFYVLQDIGDGWFRIIGLDDIRVLQNGVAAAVTAIDCSSALPVGVMKFRGFMSGIDANAVSNTLYMLWDGNAQHAHCFVRDTGTAAGSHETANEQFEAFIVSTEAVATALWYQWIIVPSSGVSVFIQAFQLKRR